MYGLAKGINPKLIVLEVCQVLGNGSNNTAHLLLLETAATETGMGTVIDSNPKNGHSIVQIDKIGFDDTLNRTSIANKNKVNEHFGIDLDLVQFNDLRYNPLLAFIICRLKYILVPSAIPDTVEARALYWKKWWNSYDPNAKGTPEHYIKMVNKYMI